MARVLGKITWDEIFYHLKQVDIKGDVIYGVPRGGMILTAFLKKAKVTHDPARADLILDDIIDSGKTREKYKRLYPRIPFFALYGSDKNTWLQFPWETEECPEDGVVRLLQYIGEDPNRDGLKGTPDRVCRAFKDMTSGYTEDLEKILSARFETTYDQMVWLKGIQFTSLCEHHLLPFTGLATIAYIPRDKVVGISKLARLVGAISRRLQIQERMTNQIAEAIETHLAPLGIGVIVEAQHQCMSCRGVYKNASMVTSCLRGHLLTKPEARMEFLTYAANH